MRVHHLVEEVWGRNTGVGGAMTEMRLFTAEGSLSEISVAPASVDIIHNPLFEGAGVKLQVGDRVVWLEPEEVETLVRFLNEARDAFILHSRE